MKSRMHACAASGGGDKPEEPEATLLSQEPNWQAQIFQKQSRALSQGPVQSTPRSNAYTSPRGNFCSLFFDFPVDEFI